MLNRLHSLQRRVKLHPTTYKLGKLSEAESRLRQTFITSKAAYESSLIESFKGDSKKFYYHLKKLWKVGNIPETIIHNSNPVHDPAHEKAIIFNNYFNSVFTRSNYILPPVYTLPTPELQLSEIRITEEEVLETLSALDPSKAPGCDNISPLVLKRCANTLSAPVTNLLNKCLQSSTLPSQWKIHKICPILKKGDPTNVQNYRPISLLCIMSKILESIIYKKIITFLLPTLNKSQFGFLKNRSCLTNLLTTYAKVFNSIDEKHLCDITFLDFSKAFDSVPHAELLHKLWLSGITGPLWFWFRDYLTNRLHYVEIDGFSSNYQPVVSGVRSSRKCSGPSTFSHFYQWPPYINTPCLNLHLCRWY